MREVARDEVSFASGFPVTTPERTIFDLVADDEDLSLVADALAAPAPAAGRSTSTSWKH